MPNEVSNPGTVYNPFLINGTDAQLQTFLLTALVVAGKIARIQQMKLDQFLVNIRKDVSTNIPDITPMQVLSMMPPVCIREQLEKVKMGNYTRLTDSFYKLAQDIDQGRLNLRTCSRDKLIVYKGIGMKTASFFIMFTRPEVNNLACLDTHILWYLREFKLAPLAPKSTPTLRKYLELEQIFLDHCTKLGVKPAQHDFDIWLMRNRGDKINVRNSSGT